MVSPETVALLAPAVGRGLYAICGRLNPRLGKSPVEGDGELGDGGSPFTLSAFFSEGRTGEAGTRM
jgi:hypothetical protein